MLFGCVVIQDVASIWSLNHAWTEEGTAFPGVHIWAWFQNAASRTRPFDLCPLHAILAAYKPKPLLPKLALQTPRTFQTLILEAR